MYPNPQDVLPLPPRPDLDQYRTRAKELAAAARAGDESLLTWAADWIEALGRASADAGRMAPRDRDRRARQIAEFAGDQLRRGEYRLTRAQFVLARAHGFESWTRLVRHLQDLGQPASGISTFERAADAIVAGDLPALERLLGQEAGLVRARSSREHRATLLHYVSANGVENYRQRTPANIVAIARRLLDAGAVVDAEADVYGGGATTLALVVTSAHPREAGVQLDLADLLLAWGARMDRDIVRDCLANGCPEAAAHLVRHGAPAGFVDAAGIGRLDLLAPALAPPRAVSPGELGNAMIMAAWYGRRDVIALLLEHGVDPGIVGTGEGQTALHVAAYQGDGELVELLVRHRAPLDVPDRVHGTPPLAWALHGWLVDGRNEAAAYARVIRALVGAGAKVKWEWLDDARIREDPLLYQELERAAT